MKKNFLKQPQNSIKQGVLFLITKTEGVNMQIISTQSKFQDLVEDYASQGRKFTHLNKDELFELTLAYLENKSSQWSWNKCSGCDDVEVIITIGMLRKLNSNLYNHQKEFLEEVKESVVESWWNYVSEILDDEVERARNQFCDLEDDYSSVTPVMFIGATKKQEVSYGR